MLFVSIGNIGSMIDDYSKEPCGNSLPMSLALRRGKCLSLTFAIWSGLREHFLLDVVN